MCCFAEAVPQLVPWLEPGSADANWPQAGLPEHPMGCCKRIALLRLYVGVCMAAEIGLIVAHRLQVALGHVLQSKGEVGFALC